MPDAPPHSVSLPRWWPRLLVSVLLLAAAAWSAVTIRLDTELLALLPQDLPAVRGLDSYSRQFASDNEVLLVADPSMPDDERDEAFRLLRPALADLSGVMSVTVPGAEWTDSAPVLAAWAAWNLPPEGFRKVTAGLEPQHVRQKLAALPELLAGALDAEELVRRQFDPLDLMAALSAGSPSAAPADDPVTLPALAITSARPLTEFQDCVDFCSAVQAKVAAVLPDETRFLLTGRPAFTAQISQQMRRDMRLMIIVAAGLSGAAFWLFYRALRPVFWILAGQALALAVALTGARLGVGSLNVISIGFACILLGISMDYSILVYHHFSSAFRQEKALWRRLRRGIWFSAATTAAAFLVLAFSSLPGLRQMAVLVACGLIAAAWQATWLLPAIWLRRPPHSRPFLQRASGRLAGFMERRGRLLLSLTVISAALGAWPLLRQPWQYYEAGLQNFQPRDSSAWRGQQILTDSEPGTPDAVFIVRAPEWEAVRRAAADLIRRSPNASAPAAALISSPSHQRANRALWPRDIVPGVRAAFDEAGLGDEWSTATLTFCRTLTDAAAGEPEAFAAITPLLEKLQRSGAGECSAVIRIAGAAESLLSAEIPAIPGAEVLPVDWGVLRQELTGRSTADLKTLAGGVVAAILLLCYAAQRSVRMVVLNLTALALALLILAALLALTGTRLNPLSLLCLPLLCGLVVDYSLHVLMTMQHGARDFRLLYAHIGAPILLTGLASCIGFGAPMLTGQPLLQNFGLVMDLGLISAIWSCLFLLPVLARGVLRPPS
jgi:predicted exporter